MEVFKILENLLQDIFANFLLTKLECIGWQKYIQLAYNDLYCLRDNLYIWIQRPIQYQCQCWCRPADAVESLWPQVVVQRCSVKKVVLKNFAKLTGKHLCHGCFLVNFVTFLKSPFATEYLWCLLLNFNHKEYVCLKKVAHQIDRKWTVTSYASFYKFYGKIWCVARFGTICTI